MNTTSHGKQITVKLEHTAITSGLENKVVGRNYEIVEISNAIVLDGKWFGLKADYRAGDTMTESEALMINGSKNITVKVVR